jgi:hypothetical protein
MNTIDIGNTFESELRFGGIFIPVPQVMRIIEIARNHDASKQVVPAELTAAQFEQAIYIVMDIKIADLAVLIRGNKIGTPEVDKSIELMAMKIESATQFLRADVTPAFLELLGKTEADADALWILGASL